MARAIWKGNLSFGLVSIPVEVFPAEERKQFQFSMLDKRDFVPVGYKRYNKKSGVEVQWNDIVKGYEYEKGEYVVLSDEDFKRANVKASHTIDIERFVPGSDVPPQYFDTPYYLVPGANGEKVYALLRETLRSTHRVAVAQFVIRSTQHLAAIGPLGRALMLFTLRYADELRGTKGFELPSEDLKESRVTPKEVDLAKRLIDDMTEKWDPTAFKDTYHEDLMARIEEKIRNRETHEIARPSAEGEPSSAKVIDLAALLRRSIDKGAGNADAGIGTGAPGKARSKRAHKTTSHSRIKLTQLAAGKSKSAQRRKRA